MFGYHVHEKAILVSLIPMALAAQNTSAAAVLFLQASVVGIYSLFPLFTGVNELMLKCIIFYIYIIFIKSSLVSSSGGPVDVRSVYIRFLFPLTVCMLSGLFFFSEICFPLLDRTEVILAYLPASNFNSKLTGTVKSLKNFEFLPLMLTSVMCALSNVCTWLFSYTLLYENTLTKEVPSAESEDSLSSSFSRSESNDDFSFLADGIDGDGTDSKYVSLRTYTKVRGYGGILKDPDIPPEFSHDAVDGIRSNSSTERKKSSGNRVRFQP